MDYRCQLNKLFGPFLVVWNRERKEKNRYSPKKREENILFHGVPSSRAGKEGENAVNQGILEYLLKVGQSLSYLWRSCSCKEVAESAL